MPEDEGLRLVFFNNRQRLIPCFMRGIYFNLEAEK